MRITWPSIAISWISARPATGVRTSSRRAGVADCNCMKAPVLFWAGTVARTHGSVTVTWASAETENRPAASAAIRWRVMAILGK